MSKPVGWLLIAVSLLCASSAAWVGSGEATSGRALLEHEAGHEAGTPHDEHDDHGEHDHGDEDHPGHVAPAPNEGADGEIEGHGEGKETGEGADSNFEGGMEGAPDTMEGGSEEAVAEEASSAWAVPAPLAVAAAAAALIAGM